MDIVDNYVIVGSSSDGFDCEDKNKWTATGDASIDNDTGNKVQGNQSISIKGKQGNNNIIYADISAGNRFSILEYDLGFWFFYSKGKGTNALVQDNTAIVVRLYFGDTSTYADYRVTEAGDLSLGFGWNLLMCSGKELNGGSTSSDFSESDWSKEIVRIELRLNLANDNDVPFNMDAWFIGNTLIISDGDENNPVTIQDLHNYAHRDRSDFPIGVVTLTKKLANINTGLIIDGGYLKATDLYLLFNQLSSEVKHNVLIENGGVFQIGDYQNSNPILGCLIVKPENKTANFSIGDSDSKILVYDSKFYRWNEIILNGYSEIIETDFDSCEIIKINNNNVIFKYNTIHDGITAIYDNVLSINENADISDIFIYRCKDGVYINNDVILNNITLLDNDGYDLGISDTYTLNLINSKFTTMRRL